MVSVFAVNVKVLNPIVPEEDAVLQSDWEERFAVGKDPTEWSGGIAANRAISITWRTTKLPSTLPSKSAGTGEVIGIGPWSDLIGTKPDLPKIVVIEKSLDPMLHAGRGLESCFEVNVEELVAIIAVMPERELKYVVARNAGCNLWLYKVRLRNRRAGLVTAN